MDSSSGLRCTFRIGFWEDGYDLIVHSFTLMHHQYHGKRLSRDRFRCKDEDLPLRILLNYHYAGCPKIAKKRILYEWSSIDPPPMEPYPSNLPRRL